MPKKSLPRKRASSPIEKPQDYLVGVDGFPTNPNHVFLQPPRPGNTYLKYPNERLLARDEVPETLADSWPYRLDEKIDVYLKKKDPLMALRCLVLCHKNEVYPPAELMNFIVVGVERYLKERGAMHLDACLGLEKKRFSQAYAKRQRERRNAYYNFWLDAWCWQVVFRLSQAKAKKLACHLYGLKESQVGKLNSHKNEYEWHSLKAEAREDFEAHYLNEMKQAKEFQQTFISKYPLSLIQDQKLKLPPWIQELHIEFK